MPDPIGLDEWKSGPTLDEHGCLNTWLADRTQFRHTAAIPGDQQLLSPSNAVDELSTVVPQVADRNLGHGLIVSPVRRQDIPLRPALATSVASGERTSQR